MRPIRSFRVGAVLRGANGKLYAGCNVENAAYPQGTCAEVAAIAVMVADGERRIVEVVVMGEGEALMHAVRRLPPASARVRRRRRRRSISAGPKGVRRTVTWANCCRWRSARTISQDRHDDGG